MLPISRGPGKFSSPERRNMVTRHTVVPVLSATGEEETNGSLSHAQFHTWMRSLDFPENVIGNSFSLRGGYLRRPTVSRKPGDALTDGEQYLALQTSGSECSRGSGGKTGHLRQSAFVSQNISKGKICFSQKLDPKNLP